MTEANRSLAEQSARGHEAHIMRNLFLPIRQSLPSDSIALALLSESKHVSEMFIRVAWAGCDGATAKIRIGKEASEQFLCRCLV